MLGRDALVGREGELERLAALVTGIDRGGLVVVEGEAGIGKSRLLAEVGVIAPAAGTRVLRGGAEDLDPRPFGVWRSPARALGLPRLGADPTVPHDEQRWDALGLLTDALDEDTPTALLLDDLHRADEASLWVLERLLVDLAHRPVVVLAAARPAGGAPPGPWAALRRRAPVVVALTGLTPDDVARLVDASDAPALDSARLCQRAGGNPLLVRELLLQPADAPTPEAVTDLLRATVEQGGPVEADVLSTLALAGQSAPVAVLATATGLDPDEVRAHVSAAASRDVLRELDGVTAFRHDLLAETAAARLDPTERAARHRALSEAWGASTDITSRVASARHALRACPTIPVETSTDAVLGLVVDLIAAGDPATAESLASEAAALLDAERASDLDRRARMGVALADALLAQQEIPRGMAAAERARDLAEGSADVGLRAAAEVAAVAHHNPFVPDEVQLARLVALDDALAAAPGIGGEHVRARLRGRRAAFLAAFPDRAADATRRGDEAVDLARATGDPELVVQALTERHSTAATVADLEAKDRAGEEIAALAASAGRPDLALVGHEWRAAARLRLGDMAGALSAVADLEALGLLMPSPRWRVAAAYRRAGLLAMLGDRDGALALTATTVDLARGSLPDTELLGLRIGAVMTVSLLYGTRPEGIEEAHRAMGDALGAVPSAFFQVRLAATDAMLDAREAARSRLAPWIPRLADALRTPEGLTTVALVAEVVDRLGWAEAAGEARTVLTPFASTVPVVTAIGATPSVDDLLAALALLDGDVGAAADHATAALALARRMGTPPLEARALGLLAAARATGGDAAAAASARSAAERIAEEIGLRLRPSAGSAATTGHAGPAVAPTSREVQLCLAEGRWAITSPLGDGEVADSRGMGQLLRLVRAPERAIAATDLAGAATGAVPLAADLGPALDARAKREYRARVAELRAEIDEADDHHDLARAERARVELDALLGELARAVGLGGRDRPQGSDAERARINVARSLRRAIAAVEGAVPDLGAHLRVSVRTGHTCAYEPEPAAALTWEVVGDR